MPLAAKLISDTYFRTQSFFKSHLFPTQPKPIYSSYEEATLQMGNYEAAEIIEVVRLKTKQLIENPPSVIADRVMLQNLFVLDYVYNQLEKKPLRVLDLGGALGANFFVLNHLLPKVIQQWQVVETPAMVMVGKKEFKASGLNFKDFNQLNNLFKKDYDLLFVQGVLHYTPEPLAYLDRLLKAKSPYVYISRQPLISEGDESFVTQQTSPLLAHGPGILNNPPSNWHNQLTHFPVTLIPKKKLESLIQQHAYKYCFEFDEERPYVEQFTNKAIDCIVRGYLLKEDRI